MWDSINPNWFHTAGGFKLSNVKKNLSKHHKYWIYIPLKNGQQFGFILPQGVDRKHILKMHGVDEDYEEDGW